MSEGLSQRWFSKVFLPCGCVHPQMTGECGAHRAWLVGAWGRLHSSMEGGRVVSWRVQAFNEQSVDLALILIGSKLSFGSPDGWQEARPGTPPRRNRDDITFTDYVYAWSQTHPLLSVLILLTTATLLLIISVVPLLFPVISFTQIYSHRHTLELVEHWCIMGK